MSPIAEARPRQRVLVALASALLAGCAMLPPAFHSYTRIEAEGSTVDFMWSSEHPWGRKFQMPGRIHLFAEYRSEGRVVNDDLGSGQSSAPRQLRFTLPNRLRQVPDAQVCLFLEDTRTGSERIPGGLIPVRAPGSETIRFAHTPWTPYVRRNTLEWRSTQVERDLRQTEKELSDFRNTCEGARTLPATDCGKEPTDTAGVPGAAQRLCVARSRDLRLTSDVTQWVDVHEVARTWVPAAGDPMAARRQAQRRGFLEQYRRWEKETGPYFKPDIAGIGGTLPIGDTLKHAIARWNETRRTRPAAPPPDELAIGLLDAYDECVANVGKQLAEKRDAWQRCVREQPKRDREYDQHKQRLCRKRLAEWQEALNARRSELERIARQRAELEGKPIPERASPRHLLNDVSCSL